MKEWIREEESYLDGFKYKGMKQHHIEDFNRSRDQIDFMRKFLNINQSIFAENETILAQLKGVINSVYRNVKSFVTK